MYQYCTHIKSFAAAIIIMEAYDPVFTHLGSGQIGGLTSRGIVPEFIPLPLLVAGGHVEIVESVLAQGVDPDAT